MLKFKIAGFEVPVESLDVKVKEKSIGFAYEEDNGLYTIYCLERVQPWALSQMMKSYGDNCPLNLGFYNATDNTSLFAFRYLTVNK